MVQVTKLKKVFHDEKLQISTDAINMMNDEIARTVRKWVRNAKDGNVKRVTHQTIHIAFGRLERYLR